MARKKKKRTDPRYVSMQEVHDAIARGLVVGLAFRHSKSAIDGAKGMVDYARPAYKTVLSSCTCGGENPNCYKCAGTGSYEMQVAPGYGLTQLPKAKATTQSTVSLVGDGAGFAADKRGGKYGLRESGKFDSRPDHDDYGDEGQA